MAKEQTDRDRNFDDLAERFQRNIYGSLKGDIRLAVLTRDFAEHLPLAPFSETVTDSNPWRVLDAGGGQGQFSLQLAAAGHDIVLCDISAEMLRLGEAAYRAQGLEKRLTVIQAPIQSLAQVLAQPLTEPLVQSQPQSLVHCSTQSPAQALSQSSTERPPESRQTFDLVLCHALMEWLAEPQALLGHLCQHLAPGGYLSLTFYNLNSLIHKNLLRGNLQKVLKQDFASFAGSLTPINPLEPETVFSWLADCPLEVLSTSGIRVVHDYILDPVLRKQAPEALMELELSLSRREPYRSLGRYLHVLARRTE